MLKICIWSFLLFMTTANACEQSTIQGESKQTITVEFNVFSGRENPKWFLSATDSKELLALIHQASPSQQAFPEVPSLGFRGFGLDAGQTRYQVYQGYILAISDAKSQVYWDTNQQVNQWLAVNSKSHLSTSLYNLQFK